MKHVVIATNLEINIWRQFNSFESMFKWASLRIGRQFYDNIDPNKTRFLHGD